LTFHVISAITMSPNLPLRRYSLRRWYFGELRRCVPICTTRPALRTASRMALASASVLASGFSM
jgi:hypothetical protein